MRFWFSTSASRRLSLCRSIIISASSSRDSGLEFTFWCVKSR